MSELQEFNGGVLRPDLASFPALQAQMKQLAEEMAKLNENAGLLSRQMADNAAQAGTLADYAAAAEVDGRFVAQIEEVAGVLAATSDASRALAGRADTLVAWADAFVVAHNEEYRNVYELVKAGAVQQAKPGFYQVR